mgnify:CR=1 FL=1
MKTALLVIDMQQALTDAQPARKDEFLLNVKFLVDAAHAGGVEVVYVRHDGGADDDLAFGTPGWQLDRSLSLREGERVFDKRFSSSFRNTGLHEYLSERGVERLVICGMQTEYCIDTSVKVAFEFGYDILIPSGATSTYDNPFLTGEKIILFYERMIWHEPLAQVVCMQDAVFALMHP